MTKGFLIDTELEMLRNGKPSITSIPDLPTALSSAIGEEAFHQSLCRHSEYLQLPFVKHHGIWFNWILTKYPLPNGNVTDFAYLVTTSASNTIVLVEIEDPAKKMWVGKPIKPEKSDPFVKALEQVMRWRADLREPENYSQLIAGFKALMGKSGMALNSWYVKYVLIYGRSSENDTVARKKMYADLQQEDIELMTFDNLVSAKKILTSSQRKNIVKAFHPGPTFSYAYLNTEPRSEFAYLDYGKFSIDKDARELLVALGFDINAWEQGKLLSANRGKDLPTIYGDV
ncbi:Shedu anti-phage system protein SduA domain-containing protein [Herminiimonas arsenitoxidans]|uniref:Shedu anti-phage system protein SduA domain-containing protein n=1 Tax=Herminiimonas arsenitoxidans TaxID=1809410 RepID=UPI0009703103|nr:Shedu anti-phage system protein SduA domain-containing protein [Herminiimonas arsenitoxidans]